MWFDMLMGVGIGDHWCGVEWVFGGMGLVVEFYLSCVIWVGQDLCFFDFCRW